jgi:hypothetical protein
MIRTRDNTIFLFLRSKSFFPEGRDELAKAESMAHIFREFVYVAIELRKRKTQSPTNEKGGKKL